MPPRANRIIQPAVRVVEPMNSGSTISTTSADFHRLVVRARRQAIGRPRTRHSAVTIERDADGGDQHGPIERIGEETQVVGGGDRLDHQLGRIEAVQAVAEQQRKRQQQQQDHQQACGAEHQSLVRGAPSPAPSRKGRGSIATCSPSPCGRGLGGGGDYSPALNVLQPPVVQIRQRLRQHGIVRRHQLRLRLRQ